MFWDDKHVYLCNLQSITPEIKINPNRKKSENIKNAKVVDVKPIMVQISRLNGLPCREVITKKKIPVKRNSVDLFIRKRYVDWPNSAYFVEYERTKYIENFEDVFTRRFSISERSVTPNELKEYIESNISPDGTYNVYLNELNEIFEKAEEYYNNAYLKAVEKCISNDYYNNSYYKELVEQYKETDVKSIVRQLRRR